MTVRLTFLGAAGTVTGSKYLIETNHSRVLVDCGLFQGPKSLRLRNWATPAFNPDGLDAVLLTHAHLDHSGYLPLLVREGLHQPVFCTDGTRDLCAVLLPDAGRIHEEDAQHANRHGYSKHHPALPLYTERDARRVLQCVRSFAFNTWFSVTPDIHVCFRRAGHILGAACVHLDIDGKRVVFSGDVGRPDDPIMQRPEPIAWADILVVESTYGNRTHPDHDPADELATVIHRTAQRGGVVLIPAFAVGRAQSLLRLIAILKSGGKIPDLPVFLNSPMAINATDIFCRHLDDHNLSPDECKTLCATAQYVRTVPESQALNGRSGPMVIISASGMATGGRVLHHLKRFGPDPKHTILFTGFQAAGTRGRSIVEGAAHVKMHGRYVPIRAQVAMLDGLSAHADADELTDWLSRGSLCPTVVFVTHGEPEASAALQAQLASQFGWTTTVPSDGSVVEV